MKKRPDGRYQAQFRIDGRTYSVYGKTAAECRRKEAERRQEITEGKYQTRENITVGAYFDRWIENREGTVKPNTIRVNKQLLNTAKHTVIDSTGTEFGALRLRKVELQNCRDLQAGLRTTGHKTRTTNDTLSLVKQVFKTAIEERLITYNPAAAVKSLKRTEEAARDTIHRALTREETAAFLEGAKDSSYRNLYIFLLHTGCRIGEAGALYRSDITDKGIQISRTITRLEDHTYKIGDDTKTAAGRRYVPLSLEAKKAIENQQIQERMLHGNVVGIKQPLFRSPGGLLLNPVPINEDIERCCKRAGIDRFTAHAFRDTFATRCVESGMQPKTLQEILGHTDISMTLGLYAHAMDETKAEQLKAVNFM